MQTTCTLGGNPEVAPGRGYFTGEVCRSARRLPADCQPLGKRQRISGDGKADANHSDVSGETGYLMKNNLSDNVSQGNGGYYVSRELAEGFLRTDQRRSFRLAFGVALSIAATSLTFVSNGVLGLFVYLLAAIAAVALIISQKMAGNPYVRLLAKNEEHWFRTDPDGAANRVGTLIRKQNDDL